MARKTLLEIYNDITADMKSRITKKDVPDVSTLGLLALVFSGAIHGMNGYLDYLWRQFLPDLCDEKGLKRWGTIFNLPRKGATYTSGFVAFTGTTDYTVDAGTLIVSPSGKEYKTEDDFIIGTTVSVSTVALDTGAEYNTTETTFSLSEINSDIDSDVSVVSGFDNGEDIEGLEAWRARILDRFRNPPHSGNQADYERWGKQVTGIGYCWCIPGKYWLGAGTVACVFATSTLSPVSTEVKDAAEDYIEAQKPVPANVSYINCTPVDVDIEVVLNPNTAAQQALIESALEDLFITSARSGATLYLWEIQRAISSTFPTDYEIIDIVKDSVSIGVDNVTSDPPELLKLGALTYYDF